MADTVSFTTSDEPPHSLAVTKAALYGSKVFRDMLDIASSEWKQRLNDYATRIKLHAYETLISTLPCFDPRNPVEWECDKTSCSAEEHERYWQETLLRGMRSYNYRPSDKVFRDTSMGGVWIDIHPQAPGDDYDLCVYHRLELREKAKTLDAKSMSSMPSFL
ncbi:hypothetical protein JCM8547_004225 [Rhodosporidiobolus lusitaniae]